MPNIRSYKELRVYQMAMAAAMKIFELSKRFPLRKDIRLQIKFVAAHAQCVRTLGKHGANDVTQPIS